VIKIYSTGSHAELSNYLIGKSKDTIIGMLVDLLTMYINDKNSSTIREFITVTLAGYEHKERKIGCDYIGIEISDEYIKFAEERLRNYEKEIEIAMKEIEKHVVIKTFKERKEKGEFTGKYGPSKNKFDNSLEKEIRLF